MTEQIYQSLERCRKCWLAPVFLGLALEVTGAVLLFTRSLSLGLRLALGGLVLWGTGTLYGKHRYRKACAEARIQCCVGLKEPEFLSGKQAAALCPAVSDLSPHRFRVDRPLYMYPAKGQLKNVNVLLAELTFGIHEENWPARRYLSGTLLAAEAPGCPEGLIVLFGEPFTETVQPTDYDSLICQESAGHEWHAFAPKGLKLGSGQVRALDALQKAVRDAVLYSGNGRVSVLLNARFYSGQYSLRSPMPRSTLNEDALPESGQVLAAAKSLTIQ